MPVFIELNTVEQAVKKRGRIHFIRMLYEALRKKNLWGVTASSVNGINFNFQTENIDGITFPYCLKTFSDRQVGRIYLFTAIGFPVKRNGSNTK